MRMVKRGLIFTAQEYRAYKLPLVPHPDRVVPAKADTPALPNTLAEGITSIDINMKG
jgi:hypothetical protein